MEENSIVIAVSVFCGPTIFSEAINDKRIFVNHAGVKEPIGGLSGGGQVMIVARGSKEFHCTVNEQTVSNGVLICQT